MRVLLRAKGWTLVVLVSLAVGIGANTALLSAINGLLIKTIPVADPDGLVRLRWTGDNDASRSNSDYGYAGTTAGGGRVSASFSYPMFEAMRDGNETLEGLAAATPFPQMNLVIDGQAEVGSGFTATGNYFGLLGVEARVGRVLSPADDRPEASPVAMISHSFWERRFGLDPNVIGTVLRVNDTLTTIVGVLPSSFTGAQGIHVSTARPRLPEPLRDRVLPAPNAWSTGCEAPAGSPRRRLEDPVGTPALRAQSGLDDATLPPAVSLRGLDR